MSKRWVPLLCLLCACSPRPAVRAEDAPQPVTAGAALFVDERALEGGDGSAARPFRTLRQALQTPRSGPTVIEIASGLYEGPFAIDAGVKLRGRGGVVVLHSDAAVTVTATGGALERVMIQGGQVGLQVANDVRVERVEFSGQRRLTVDVTSGALHGAALKLEATVSETVGLSLKPSAKATLTSSRWVGPYRRGIEQHGGELLLEGAKFDDSVIAVHVRAGQATLTDVRISGGREAAVLVGAARVGIEKISVRGHEYGLLAGEGADLTVRAFEATRTDRAGIALTAAKARIDGVRVHEGGSCAAIQLTQSTVKLENAEITKATSAGILINGGEVELKRVVVNGARNADGSSGDGILARTGKVRIHSARIGQAEGAGIVSGNAAEMTVSECTVDGARHGAFVADYKGKLTANRVVARNVREAVFVAIEGASMSVQGAVVESSPDGLAWVDCASGSSLKLRNVQSAAAPPPSACIDAAP